jgi:hypothetical protein
MHMSAYPRTYQGSLRGAQGVKDLGYAGFAFWAPG